MRFQTSQPSVQLLVDVFDVVVGPSLVVFGLELSTMQHFAVGFHPAGGTPWRGVKLEFALGGGLSTLDEGDAILAVMIDGEILEFLVAFGVIVSVHVFRVIAAMDCGAAEGVTIAFNGIETGFEELFLSVFGELGKGGGCGIGEGTTKTQDGLEGLFIVDEDSGDILVGLIERREGKETAVGEQLRGAGDLGSRGGRRRCGYVNAGFLVMPFLGGG